MTQPWSEAASPPVVDQVGRIFLPLQHRDFLHYRHDLTIAGRRLQEKSEYHITLIGSALAEKLRVAGVTLALARALVARNSPGGAWRYRLGGQYRHCRRSTDAACDESVVAMAEVELAQCLFDDLRSATGLDFERPPLHVTLLTFGNPNGIGLPSLEVLDSLTASEIPAQVLLAASPIRLGAPAGLSWRHD